MRTERRGVGWRERVGDFQHGPTLSGLCPLDNSTDSFHTEWRVSLPGRRLTSLMGMLFDPQGLDASFGRQSAKKAPPLGVDGMRKEDYAEGLAERIADLSDRLRRLGSPAPTVPRVYIPKGEGRRRALGIPCFEDRLVQDVMRGILQAIWEPEFRDCSYGFRPGRSAHDAPATGRGNHHQRAHPVGG